MYVVTFNHRPQRQVAENTPEIRFKQMCRFVHGQWTTGHAAFWVTLTFLTGTSSCSSIAKAAALSNFTHCTSYSWLYKADETSEGKVSSRKKYIADEEDDSCSTLNTTACENVKIFTSWIFL